MRREKCGRVLGRGDLALVLLSLIEEDPRHGYELMKLIQKASSNQYVPSPGVVYPTLTYLEDMRYLKTNAKAGRRRYSITREGRRHLEEHNDASTTALTRLREVGARLAAEKAAEPFEHEERSEIRELFYTLRSELKSLRPLSNQNKKDVVKLLKRTLTEVRKMKVRVTK
jgi:DNA-binding PadR family transcriptional regulator